jgi:hypothetical protein
MKLKLGTTDIFDAPEGKYKATLERIAEPKKKIDKLCAAQVRLTFRTKARGGKEYLVARTFCADLSHGGELYNFLSSWLNGNFDPFLDSNGDVDLDLLVGREAEVSVTHYKDGLHSKPFIKLSAIFPSR